ncbi:hypothetical protein [Capnocytophaga canis]|uniref:hypothetical protein n=1 Tax=Capnocytophaga canis TaxID=1848903 RepID=UPI0037D175BA
MPQTAFEYYNSPKDFGSYQYIPLSDVINSFMAEIHLDNDHFLKNKPRSLFLLHAKRGVKELSIDMPSQLKGLELEIGSDLQFIMPQDFLDWVRVSVVSEQGELLPLDLNTNSHLATSYLQDNDGNILFTNAGDVLEADGNNAYNIPMKNKTYEGSLCTPKFNLNTSYFSKYGMFAVDKSRGVFLFDSNLAGKSIVIEYISDGLEWENLKEEEIKIHKYYEQPLIAWIYWKMIERDKNIPMNEKLRAEKQFNGAKQKSFSRFANINVQGIKKAMANSTVWIKV